ncbi:condensin-1 complex subunit CAP-D2 isoform X1 [Ricinus communis]|uniref:condensin-1 complex subunit CAP-D2 isoform X2 n=1 Tax=Ricinus communis TaxID=3988 RepID=UPI00201A3338|nr:condensin-1 complex subunit CAP-D2 isoform X2 [Ricinus communis]XP_015580867.2 condensin-1 complex subunit CAP-D2 isoform X1 [Ricinus communis]
MAPHFVFPQNFRSLQEEPADNNDNNNRLYVQNLTDVVSLRPSDLEEFVKGLCFDLSDKELFCIEEQEVFDRVYSLVLGFSSLTPSCKLNFVESLRSNLSVLLPNVDSLSRVSQCQDGDDDHDHLPLLDRVTSHRNAFKIYSFFLLNIVLSEESNATVNGTNSRVITSTRKKKPLNSWNWEPQRGRILNLIANSLEVNLALLFGSSNPDENYLSFIAKNAFSMCENPVLLKDSDAKDALCRIIGACATKYHYTAQSCASIMHIIHKYDFVVTHMADAVAGAEKKYADGTLASSLIREIGRTNPKAYVKDTVGAENVGRFLVELADRMPKLISTHIALLVPHFGGESYKIRNALVGVLGKLVAKAFKDVEGEVSSQSVRLRTKQAMLEILLERCRDVSAYTRSRVLQVWAELCEEHSVSMGLWNEVAAVAAGRLEDKTAMVRKAALNLLIMMLQHNPFGPQLRIASFEATLEQYKKKLNELEPDESAQNARDGLKSDNDASDGGDEVDNVNAEEVAEKQQESLTDSCLPHMEDGITQKDSSVPDVGNLEQTRALVASLEAGLRFSKCISATMPTLVQLMASSSATDVENTILLLMRCRQFQIDGAEECLRKMLPLVFSQDKSIYEAVENAFIAIYVRKLPVETAKNILSLAIDSNIGDLAALEFIINALVSKGEISTSTISALWDFFCFNVSGTTAEQSRGALSVLCMAAKSSTGVLGSHLQDIIDIGFGRWAKVEPLLARLACVAIQRLSADDRKKLLVSNGSRIFGILESLITGFWLPENIWYAAADKAISTIYTIHPTPETLAADIVKKSLSSIFDCSGGNDLQNNVESGSTAVVTAVQVSKLSRYLFIISHVAMNQLLYIESCVRKIQKQKIKEKMVTDGGNVHNTVPKPADSPNENNINAELGVAASEDAILDALSERAEQEIISSGSNEKNLIGLCVPFLSKLCRNISLMQRYPILQASAMLALCRFMIIDAHFCDANLQLLFTVVESAPSETVRTNCTIALGDLAVRFPNLLEPWTENMYARLRDPSVSVRKNAVLVLSHLILNDMMKVKGYLNEMALCLEDEDERISNLAKLFFHELSKKGSNPVYNLLPDILSKLSVQNLNRESFCNIMQFLIGSIKKDKQMEALVEKLCNRFSGVTDVKQWEYISYCLSQLAFTEKGIRKLIESFKSYEHALLEDSVADHFKSIINKAKKFAKPELKLCIEEFEEKLQKFHMEKKEQEVTARNAQIHRQKVENVERVVMARNEGEECEGSNINEDGEVIDPSMEGISQSKNVVPDIKLDDSDGNSGISSELTETELGETEEVQSPRVTRKGTGTSRSRAKKSNTIDHKSGVSASTRRYTRSKQR